MSKKIFIVGGSELEPLFGLLSLVAGILGAEIRTEEVKEPKEVFDETTYTKPFIPKVLVGYERSNSQPGVSYRIVKDKDGNLYCNCKGFVFRGSCRHVDAAKRKFAEKPKFFPKAGTTVRRFNSRTQSGVVYDVNLLNGEFICTCPGFQYNGTCKHIIDVKKSIRFPWSI